jgi:hypothetical protein
VIGIAKATCVFCHGYGLRPALRGAPVPCACVFRAIFRICHARYRECEAMAAHAGGISLERARGPSRYRIYARKREEYTADFGLVARRSLNLPEYELFRLHYLGDADWHICCRRLRLDRGTFFHCMYAITERLGRTFAELRPYPLYPIAGYFGAVQSSEQYVLPLEADGADYSGGAVESSDQHVPRFETDAGEEPPLYVFRWGPQRMVARH